MQDLSKQEKLSLIAEVPFFFHSIDCGDGVVTPGRKSASLLKEELAQMRLPDLSGKTVLDVGAWDGYFSFAAEAMGAKRVLALDHYVWSIDQRRRLDYVDECNAKQRVRRPYHLLPGIWKPENLPGKRGFDVVHRIRKSAVEQMVADFMTVNLVEIGQFDVVFFLGVLYHLMDPLEALRRLALVTRELAVIETAAIYYPNHECDSLLEFYEQGELLGDVSNWFAPNLLALTQMCRAAGFNQVKVVVPYPPTCDGHRCRMTVHALKND